MPLGVACDVVLWFLVPDRPKLARTDQKEVIVLSNPTYKFTVLIDAPVHSVFEHCLDPRGIYVGDPMMKVPM